METTVFNRKTVARMNSCFSFICSVLLLVALQEVSPQEVFPAPAFKLSLEQSNRLSPSTQHGRRLFNMTAPLFEGIGTHYSFIWVGTPPQRVSVIMDTGSHHTAFPCTGCNCGKRVRIIFYWQISSLLTYLFVDGSFL
jgi:hypothetical protein